MNKQPYPTITIQTSKVPAIKRFHPWIFSGAIASRPNHLADGDVVSIVAQNGEYLATGHFNDGSIAVRVLSFEKVEIGFEFWHKKIKRAFLVREKLGLTNNPLTNAYRLVHAEGDELPGLIIDIYGNTAVIQCHSVGMHRSVEGIAAALEAVFGGKLCHIYDKSKEALPEEYAETVQNRYLKETAEKQPMIKENGHSFFVDWEIGQKTGFFLDQRENRQLLTKFAAGRRILNTFCYSGGFSVYALSAGAALVHSVDASQKAVDWAQKNVRLNQATAPHETFAMDTVKFFKETDNFYDVVIVDPPAFAKNIKARHNAVQGYKRLNQAAIQKIGKEGGVLFTFSCSQVIDRELFENTITAAALEVGRPAQVLYRLTQPADHPVNVFHPEGSYLKGLVLYVHG